MWKCHSLRSTLAIILHLAGTTLPIYPGLGLALGVHSLVCSKAAIERSRTRHYIKLEKDALLLKVVALSVSRDILTES